MATRDTIVIGASAGGVQALSTLVAGLPGNLPAAVFIVLHIPTDSPSLLPDILARESSLPVAHATHGEPIVRGRVFVAPPDQHLMIEDNRIKLVRGPKENLHRPSIDTLFRSAAHEVGSRAIGVILTGARDDGKVGMRAIKLRGGLAIVQDPAEAPFASMPMNVLQSVPVDYRLPLRQIGPLLQKLSRHAYSAESLSGGQAEMLEMALWSAVRALEEQMMLARRIVERARRSNHRRAAETFERRALEAERSSATIRQLLLGDEKGGIAEPVIENREELSTS